MTIFQKSGNLILTLVKSCYSRHGGKPNHTSSVGQLNTCHWAPLSWYCCCSSFLFFSILYFGVYCYTEWALLPEGKHQTRRQDGLRQRRSFTVSGQVRCHPSFRNRREGRFEWRETCLWMSSVGVRLWLRSWSTWWHLNFPSEILDRVLILWKGETVGLILQCCPNTDCNFTMMIMNLWHGFSSQGYTMCCLPCLQEAQVCKQYLIHYAQLHFATWPFLIKVDLCYSKHSPQNRAL